MAMIDKRHLCQLSMSMIRVTVYGEDRQESLSSFVFVCDSGLLVMLWWRTDQHKPATNPLRSPVNFGTAPKRGHWTPTQHRSVVVVAPGPQAESRLGGYPLAPLRQTSAEHRGVVTELRNCIGAWSWSGRGRATARPSPSATTAEGIRACSRASTSSAQHRSVAVDAD